jgi:hypothetical protein
LVEAESGCAGMPGQHLLLLDIRVEAEAESGVPVHRLSASQSAPTTPRHVIPHAPINSHH